MEIREQLIRIFIKVFCVEESSIAGMTYRDCEAWDSVGQMTLIAEIEDTFEIELEPEDIMKMTSFDMCVSILEKYL